MILLVEDRGEVVAGVGFGVGGDLFGGACGYDFAACGAAFGAHVDDPVGGLDDVEVVLDDEEGSAAFDEFAERLPGVSGRRRSGERSSRI
jgi:hypothetical protein